MKDKYLKKLASSDHPHSVFTGIACGILLIPIPNGDKIAKLEELVEALEEVENVLYSKG